MDGPVITLKGMESRLNRCDGISGEDRDAFKVQMMYLKRFSQLSLTSLLAEMLPV